MQAPSGAPSEAGFEQTRLGGSRGRVEDQRSGSSGRTWVGGFVVGRCEVVDGSSQYAGGPRSPAWGARPGQRAVGQSVCASACQPAKMAARQLEVAASHPKHSRPPSKSNLMDDWMDLKPNRVIFSLLFVRLSEGKSQVEI